MKTILLLATMLLLGAPGLAQERVFFPTADGGLIYADQYGTGERAVVLAHGARFNKESWAKQAPVMAAAGFRVLAIDFRGYGQSRGPSGGKAAADPLPQDILGAVRYLRRTGATSVAVVGGSMGGTAAGDASIASQPGEIGRLVLLGAASTGAADKLRSATLFLVAEDDPIADEPGLPNIRAQYQRAPQPKSLVILKGSAHAQFLFTTEQGERVMQEILKFLSAG